MTGWVLFQLTARPSLAKTLRKAAGTPPPLDRLAANVAEWSEPFGQPLRSLPRGRVVGPNAPRCARAAKTTPLKKGNKNWAPLGVVPPPNAHCSAAENVAPKKKKRNYRFCLCSLSPGTPHCEGHPPPPFARVKGPKGTH